MTRQPSTPAAHRRKPRKARDPIDLANAKLPPELARSRYGKWRFLSLLGIYVLMSVHIMHWKASGETMAPLELSEIMKALELGVVSPGVIFIGIMIVGSAIFGRFFCSWGCHMLALQDLSHWILKKLRIRPVAIRSRVLLLVPFLAAGYMFLYPQVKRIWQGRALPEASSRLVTTDFWRDLPGPLVIALTFLTCGFLIVYFFGGRGFCTYGCPYGVLFGLFDRFAPGKIRTGGGCQQCGRCTAICTSGVRVHEEIKAYGMVVNSRCMKDLDCVSVCPHDALHYGFGRPAIARSGAVKKPAVQYDFSMLEECAMVVIFALGLFTWRGLYDTLPFLMSLALSAITAYLAIIMVRLLGRAEVKVNRYVLKHSGRLLQPGYVFIAVTGVFMLFTLHSGFIQYHRWRGEAIIAQARAIGDPSGTTKSRRAELLNEALDHLQLCERYGLFAPTPLLMETAVVLLELERPSDAERHLWRAVERNPAYAEARVRLAGALASQGRGPEAAEQLKTALRIYSPHEEDQARMQHLYAGAHIRLGSLMAERGRFSEAQRHFAEALSLDEQNTDAYFGLGTVAAAQGRGDEALAHCREAIRIAPQSSESYSRYGDVLTALMDPEAAIDAYEQALVLNPDTKQAQFKIGVLSLHLSRPVEAVSHFAAALEDGPNLAELRNYYGLALEQSGRPGDARAQYQHAVDLNGNFADAQFNLGRLYAQGGEREEAARHFGRAAKLDSRYAQPPARD